MSLTYRTVVACDALGCTKERIIEHELRTTSMLSRSVALRSAVDDGWQVNGAENFCEFHRTDALINVVTEQEVNG